MKSITKYIANRVQEAINIESDLELHFYVEFLLEFNKCIKKKKNVISSNLLHMYNPDERIRIIEIDIL